MGFSGICPHTRADPFFVGRKEKVIPTIQIRNLNIRHRKDLHPRLEDFQLTLCPGDKAVIVGEEGNGKSTLLKWIYDPAMIEPYAEAEGVRTDQGEKLGYLPQELTEADKKKTVYEFFSAAEGFWEQDPWERQQLLARLGLDGDVCFSQQLMGTLSGGEKVKLQMARLLMEQCDVWLLDEPSNDVDADTLSWMEGLIRDFPGAVLFISHDETLIEATANRVILLEQLRGKRLTRWTVANVPFRSSWQSGRPASPSRLSLPKASGGRSGSPWRSSAAFSRRWRASKTPSPARIPTADGC